MMPTTEYKLLDSEDGIVCEAEPMYPAASSDSKEYPGNRRHPLHGSPPKGCVFIKTGGNALMAVDRAVLEHQQNSNALLVSAVVPHGKGPGDNLLVKCPYHSSGRLISISIPEGVGAGQVLLIQVPPTDAVVDKQQRSTMLLHDDGNVIPSSHDYDDLKLAAEIELERRHFGDYA